MSAVPWLGCIKDRAADSERRCGNSRLACEEEYHLWHIFDNILMFARVHAVLDQTFLMDQMT